MWLTSNEHKVFTMKPYNGFSEQQRNDAQAWLNAQWRTGMLQRPCKCVACGQDKGIIDAHAEDYSIPYMGGKTDEYHLCFRCHMMVHCRFRNLNRWKWYKEAVASGMTFKPFYSRDFNTFAAQTLNALPPLDFMGEPRTDVLGRIG